MRGACIAQRERGEREFDESINHEMKNNTNTWTIILQREERGAA